MSVLCTVSYANMLLFLMDAFLLLFWADTGEAYRLHNYAGPYRVIVGHLEDCPPEMRPAKAYHELNYTGIRDRVDTNTWWYSGHMTTFITADDNYTFEGNLASWDNVAGWKTNFFMGKVPNVCSAAKTYSRTVWRKAMKRIFNDEDRDCPFPPGHFSVTNFSTNFNVDKPPVFFYGKYRGTAQVFHTKTGTVVTCYRGIFSLVPRAKSVQQSGN